MFSRFGNRRSSFFAIRFDSIRFDLIRVGELRNTLELFFLKTGKITVSKKIDLDFAKKLRYKMLFHDFQINVI